MKKSFTVAIAVISMLAVIPVFKYYMIKNDTVSASVPIFTDAPAVGETAEPERPSQKETSETQEGSAQQNNRASDGKIPTEKVSEEKAVNKDIFLSRSGDVQDTTKKQDIRIVDINQVYSYDIMTKDIKRLAEVYPDLIEYKSLGATRYNREIWAVKLGKGKPDVFINGSHHAREWSTTSISMYMLDRYTNAYVNNENFDEFETRDILDKISIWFVPMVNPDGVTLQQEGIDAFPEEARSKLLELNGGSLDFGSWKANAEGIDLNRQYPADWENIVNNAAGPSYQNYKGTKPLTAVEAKALADFTYKINPEITLSYHDSGRILYWNFHNKPEAVKRDSAITAEFSNLTGYTPVPPEPNPSGGGYKDWFIQEFGRPGFTAEIGEFANNRSIPVSKLPSEWERNRKIGLFLANEGYKLWLERNR